MKRLTSIMRVLLFLLVEVLPATWTFRESHQQYQSYDTDILKDNSDLQLSAGADYIKASWLKEFKATSYSINWTPKDHGGTYTMDGGNNISYTITDLQPCTDYTVTVQPMKNSSKEGLPLTATTTTTIADPDPKLKVVTVKSQSSTQLFVNWTAAQGVGNCCVTYLITWGPASKAHGGGSATTTSLNYSITQLDTWTIYHVCVAAQTRTDYNKDTCADGRTDEDAPGPPVITSVVSSSFSSIRVSWSSPENPNGIITKYNVSWTWEGNKDHDITNDTTTSCTITDLTPCTNYSVTVTATTSKGYGPESKAATGTTHSKDPDPVTGVNVNNYTDNSTLLDVNWSEVQDVGNCDVTYKITWSPASNGDGSNTTTTTSLSYIITQLEAWTTYHVCVASKTNSSYTSDTCMNGTTDEDTPGPPVITSVVSFSFSSIKVSWSPPENPNGIITEYNVSWTWEGNKDHDITNDTTTSCTITDLTPCTNYSVTVTAATSKGYGPESKAATGTTDSKDPDPVTGVNVNNYTDNSTLLDVSWWEVQDVGNCDVTYKITWSPASNDDGSNTTTTTSLSYIITQLEAWTTYHVCVASKTNSSYSNDTCMNGTTDEDTPGPPADTRIHSETSHSLLVAWKPPEKPRGIITNYTVTWNPSSVNGNNSDHVNGNITHYNITSLEACIPYIIKIKAATIKGYGDQYIEANGTTSDKPPEATQKVTCDPPTIPRYLTVSWSTIRSSCPVRRYSVNYTGRVLWSHNNTHDSRCTDSIYVDLKNLTSWTTYNVCVAGVIANDIVGAWNCCQATTLESAPGPPASLKLIDKTSSSAKMCWDEPVQLNGELSVYQLTWGAYHKNLSHNLTSYTISGLQSNSQYNVTLQAITAGGVGPPEWEVVTTDKGVNVGGIVAGVVVGVLLLAVIVAAVVFRDKLKDKLNKGTSPTLPPRELPMTPRQPSVANSNVKKNKLQEYLEYLEGDTQHGLEMEFSHINIQSPSLPAFAAKKDFNKPKNRFANIHPFDHARVKLSPISGVTGSDYINATYILDIYDKPYFIASQGPKQSTMVDFWRMVLEQRVYTIVMLTNVMEKGREKCAHYWPRPSESFINVGSYIVHNHREERRELYSIRYLEVVAGDQKRVVKQYHFTSWPDFGALERVTDLLDFMADIRSTMLANGDHLLVHCSAGVGRTGTFIGLWNLMDESDRDRRAESINIRQTVLKMREHRPIMVQSAEQFLYLTKCIAAYIEAPHLWSKYQEDNNHIYDNGAFEDDNPIYANTEGQ